VGWEMMGYASRGGRRIAVGLSSKDLHSRSLQSSKSVNETEMQLVTLISRGK
jgi:hypothetical protein